MKIIRNVFVTFGISPAMLQHHFMTINWLKPGLGHSSHCISSSVLHTLFITSAFLMICFLIFSLKGTILRNTYLGVMMHSHQYISRLSIATEPLMSRKKKNQIFISLLKIGCLLAPSFLNKYINLQCFDHS